MSHINLNDYQSSGGDRANPIRRRNSLTPASALSNNVLSTAGSVLKIYCYYSSPDFGQPWQLERSKMSTSSGFVVKWEGKSVIITNAHAVSHANTVQVKRHGASRKYIARILCVSDTNDLAVLTVDDSTFWHQLYPLKFASELPQINEACYVVGFPMGGDEISFTSGVVSRLGVNTFAHSGENWLSIQIDAAINPGNSGGCVVSKSYDSDGFRVVGCAFETMTNANSIGYMIAVPVIINMLESYSTHNVGTPSLNLMTQSIESQSQRDSLFIPPLSGLIDYLYDTSGSDSTADLASLMHTIAAGKCGEEENPNTLTPSSCSDNDDTSPQGSPAERRINRKLQSQLLHGSSADNKSKKGSSDPCYTPILSSARFNRRRSLCSSEVYQALHTVVDQDEEYDYVTFNPVSCTEGVCSTTSCTPVYRIKRASTCKTQKAPKQLALYLDPSRVNDTSIGILITDVVPFSKSSKFLEEGDILLSISGVPISSDQTIILRENERVKFTHLISSTHIGDKITVVISRGFDIIKMDIPIEEKQYIAKWSQYNIPSYLCCLGLIMSPLTSNLMECEYGANWADSAPILLLEALFLGTFHRFHQDEQAVVLTQVLSHEITQGYSYTMRRITDINGERVINLKHCATIIARAIQAYEHHISVYPLISRSPSATPSQTPDDTADFASDATKSMIQPVSLKKEEMCLLDKHGRRVSLPPDEESLARCTAALPPAGAAAGALFQPTSGFLSNDDEMSPSSDQSAHKNAMKQSKQHVMSKLPFIQEATTTTTRRGKSDPDDQKYPDTPELHILGGTTRGKNPDNNMQVTTNQGDVPLNKAQDYSGSGNESDDERDPTPRRAKAPTQQQTKPAPLPAAPSFVPPVVDTSTASGRHQLHLQHLHHQSLHKYLTFTLQNNHKITLSLENGRKNQLDILKANMIPIPGCSNDIAPPYRFKVSILGQELVGEDAIDEETSEKGGYESSQQNNVPPNSELAAPASKPTVANTPRHSQVDIPYASKLYTPRPLSDDEAPAPSQSELIMSPPLTTLPPAAPSPYVHQPPYVMGSVNSVGGSVGDVAPPPHIGGVVQPPQHARLEMTTTPLPHIIDEDSNLSQEHQTGTTVVNDQPGTTGGEVVTLKEMGQTPHYRDPSTNHHRDASTNRTAQNQPPLDPRLDQSNNVANLGEQSYEIDSVPEQQHYANKAVDHIPYHQGHNHHYCRPWHRNPRDKQP